MVESHVGSKGGSASFGPRITGLRGSKEPFHAIDRIMERGVRPQEILDAVRNPTEIVKQGLRTRYTNGDVAVVLDANGQIVTVMKPLWK